MEGGGKGWMEDPKVKNESQRSYPLVERMTLVGPGQGHN